MKFRSLAAMLWFGFVSLGAIQNPNHSQPDAADYRLGPEDVIQVTVYKECPDLCVDNMVIRPDGKISISLIGELAATGKTSSQLTDEITKKLTDCCLSEPKVNVVVKEVNSQKVSVLGEVNKPGTYKIGTRTTLLDAIAQAGGFTVYAKKDKIIVMRNTPDAAAKPYQFDVDRMIKNSQKDLFYLLPYDTIYVQ